MADDVLVFLGVHYLLINISQQPSKWFVVGTTNRNHGKWKSDLAKRKSVAMLDIWVERQVVV